MAEKFSLAFTDGKLVASSPTTPLLNFLHSPFSLVIQVVVRSSHVQKVPEFCGSLILLNAALVFIALLSHI